MRAEVEFFYPSTDAAPRKEVCGCFLEAFQCALVCSCEIPCAELPGTTSAIVEKFACMSTAGDSVDLAM